jgi:formylglycine-generating enzyme
VKRLIAGYECRIGKVLHFFLCDRLERNIVRCTSVRNILFFMAILALSASMSYAGGAAFTDPATGIEFVFVKGGCFAMGEEASGRNADRGPVHTVCVDDFYLGKYEVTQKQWVSVTGRENPSFFANGDTYPVERVTFETIQPFLAKFSELTGKACRLPTEAEWEYAARGGGKKVRYAGTNKERDLDKYAWYRPNAGHKTHPVGTKLPNELGLHDMSGNVWEWVSDRFDAGYYRVSPRVNPQGPDTGTVRVLRGGSWFSDTDYVHVSNRGRAGEWAMYSGITGFRLALSAK